jgi:hypothetical protein
MPRDKIEYSKNKTIILIGEGGYNHIISFSSTRAFTQGVKLKLAKRYAPVRMTVVQSFHGHRSFGSSFVSGCTFKDYNLQGGKWVLFSSTSRTS